MVTDHEPVPLDGGGWEQQGRDRFRTGDYRAAVGSHERAFVAYRDDGDALSAARCARLLAWLHENVDGDWAVAAGWTRRAVRLLEPVDDPAARGWLLHLRAAEDPALERQHEAYRTGHRMGLESGDVDLEVDGLVGIGLTEALLGRPEEAVRVLDEAMATVCAGEVHDMYVTEGAVCVMFQVCELTHDVPRADQWLRSTAALVTEHGMIAVGAFCRAHWGGILTAAGRWDEAELTLVEASRIFAGGYVAARGTALVRLAALRVQQGRFDEAPRLLEGLESLPEAVVPLAAVELSQGRFDAARHLLQRALDAMPPAGPGCVALLALLMEADAAVGDVAGAREVSRRLDTLAAQWSAPYPVACAALARARLGLLAGADGAGGCVEEAAAAFLAAGMPVEAARAQVLLARVLAPSEPDRARRAAEMALRALRRHGARYDADVAAALLRDMGVPATTATRCGQPLTTRESEVLALLAEGLTNAEIGARLFISPRTVEHHVAHLLTKLGARNRAEAVAHAALFAGST